MPRLRILPVPNFNPAVYGRDVRTRKVMPALGSVPLVRPTTPGPINATRKCTGGEYHCPPGWDELPILTPPLAPGVVAPTYEAQCRNLEPPHQTLPAKQAIVKTLPPIATGEQYDMSKHDKGSEKCEYVCPEGTVVGKVVGAPYLPPPCVAPGSAEAADPELLGVPQSTWAIGAAAFGLAAIVGIGALFLSRRRSALPNFGDPSAFGGECGYRRWWVFREAPEPGESDWRPAFRRWERKIIAWVRAGKPGLRPKPPTLGYDDPSDAEPLGDEIEDCHTRLMGGKDWGWMANSAELMAEYLPRSPEAALMLMPPAIPSYLAYQYAIKRMRPEDAEFVEQWRDFAPEGASDDGLYFEQDDWED